MSLPLPLASEHLATSRFTFLKVVRHARVVKQVCIEVPSVPKQEHKVPSLPKNYYSKKPLVSEDNCKKVPSISTDNDYKVPSVPKQENKKSDLPKNDYKKPLIPEDSYKKVPTVSEIPLVFKPKYKMSQMKNQWPQFACALTYFLIATSTMAYSPYSYGSTDTSYNKVPITLTKSEEFKVSSLPKNDYYKKPSISKDNYKKVLSVPKQEYKVPSVPKYEYNVPSLPKN
ncbi:hypothetical protein H5410_061267 [Solanum commersonii]|uniref:Uncharacterized protein n=1 Tax=Solanum commersonii TaxID=4109 RepID=A0A9J5W7A4_SOLCO|nr:hypothetical protein H5410_061267 [Solanum commersonii]